ncbi:MAG: phosphatase PAP2 family protein [Methylotenera sp.]|nr:phosphatase PAP2 family protein [Methylotenera sp.]
MIFIYPHTNLDAWLIAPFYDTQLASFPLKRNWLIETVMHLGFKYVVMVISLIFLGLFLFGFVKNNSPLWVRKYHRAFIWTFISMVISTTAISILKHMSNHSCPWDLTMYGGSQPYLALFDALPIGAKPGHCFPGGHASAGFSLMAIYFGFRDTQPTLAKTALYAGLIAGLVMGWGQMMRGAHFMSHNLWTGLIVWMLLLALYLLWSPQSKNPTKIAG